MEKKKYRIQSTSTTMYTVKVGIYNSFLHLHLVGVGNESDSQECYIPKERAEEFYEILRAASGEPVGDISDAKGIVADFDVEDGKVVSITTGEGTLEFAEPTLG